MRYAIYFTPPRQHPLTRAAAEWLGRDPFADADVGPSPPGETEQWTVAEWRERTEMLAATAFTARSSRPSGLPMVSPWQKLEAMFDAFCAGQQSFYVGLGVGGLGQFVALLPVDPPSDLGRIAADAVEHFNSLRAPLSEDDLIRRKSETLSDYQRAMLARYGYPFVLDEFRFHMTLTDRIEDAEERRRAQAMLDDHFGPKLADPVAFDRLAIFMQPSDGAPFRVVRQALLGSGNRSSQP